MRKINRYIQKDVRTKGFRITILSKNMTNQSDRIVYLIHGPLNRKSRVQDFFFRGRLKVLAIVGAKIFLLGAKQTIGGRKTLLYLILKHNLCWRQPSMPTMRAFFIRGRNSLFRISPGAYSPLL